jgi:hypothetical protein
MLFAQIRVRWVPILVINGLLFLGLLLRFDWSDTSRDNFNAPIAGHAFNDKAIDTQVLEELRLLYDSFLRAQSDVSGDESADASASDGAPLLTLEQQVGEVGMLQLPEGTAVLKAVVKDDDQHYAVLMLENGEGSTDIKVADEGDFFGLIMSITNNTTVRFSNSDLKDDIILRLYE